MIQILIQKTSKTKILSKLRTSIAGARSDRLKYSQKFYNSVRKRLDIRIKLTSCPKLNVGFSSLLGYHTTTSRDPKLTPKIAICVNFLSIILLRKRPAYNLCIVSPVSEIKRACMMKKCTHNCNSKIA